MMGTLDRLRLVEPHERSGPRVTSRPRSVSRRRRIERFGDYVLHGMIARGGMATVWRATAPDGREVALKRMLPTIAESARSVIMFSEEALLGMRLRHPRLVHTFELGARDKEPFLVMELVRGPNLSQLLHRSSKLMPAAAALSVAAQLLEGLIVLHELADDDGEPFGLVHRDVSPANILLTMDGELKLGDFGIAEATRGQSGVGSRAMQGKIGYMAPEQLAGQALDARADVFAAGAVLLECLSGRRAFARDHELATLAANYGGWVPGIDASVPAPIAEVLQRALAQQPDERFPSARAFSLALAQAERTLGLSSGREQLVRFLLEHQEPSAAGLCSTARLFRGADVNPPRLPPGAGVESRMAAQVARAAKAIATGDEHACDGAVALGLERKKRLFAYRFGEPRMLRERGLVSPAATMAALDQIARRHASGLLVARTQEREMRVFFDEGSPIFVACNQGFELLGERLVRLGHVSERQVELAVERAARWDCPLGEALIDMGMASSRLVFAEIRQQMRERLADLASWTQGELGFVEHARPGLVAVRLRSCDYLGANVA